MKAKGLIVKPFPKHWTNWMNPDKENDKFTKEEIKFNNSILIEKRPMFMKYLYPTYKLKFKKYYESYEYLCYRQFGMHLEELMKLENKTEAQQNIIDKYYKFNPLLDNNCVMNNICKYMESKISEIKINVSQKNNNEIFNILYNNKFKITSEQINEMVKIYKEYNKKNKAKDIIYEEKSEEINVIKNENDDCLNYSKISDNIQILANLAVYVNYYLFPNSNKNFCWETFSDGILLNIYDNSNKEFFIPLKDKKGIEYMGKYYKNQKVVIDYDNF